MNDKQLEAFLSVAECGSFSAAARKQYISPQAMIQQIDLLEKEVGVPLLTRTHRGVTLTEAGKQFHQGVLSISLEMRALLKQVRQTQHLRVGLFDMSQMIEQVCESFSAKYPQIKQTYSIIDTAAWLETLKHLRTGQLDVFEHAEVPEVYQDGLQFLPLIKNYSCCAISANHPLASKPIIHPSELNGMKVGIHDESCVPGLRAYLQREAPDAILINDENAAAFAFDICSDGGVFLIPDNFCPKLRPLKTVPLDCDLHWTFGLVYKSPPSPTVQLFIDNARACFESL